MFEISVSGSFEAAHFLDVPNTPDIYRRMHGHSFVVSASVSGERPDGSGWILDLGRLENALKAVLTELDHSVLNEIPGLEKPTFENLLLWIEAGLKSRGFTPSRIEIERPTVRQRAVYTPGR